MHVSEYAAALILVGRAFAHPTTQTSSTTAASSDAALSSRSTKQWPYPLPDDPRPNKQQRSNVGNHQEYGGKRSPDGSWKALSPNKRQAGSGSGTCSHGTPACCAAGVADWDPMKCSLGVCDGSAMNMVPVCCLQTTNGLQCSMQEVFAANLTSSLGNTTIDLISATTLPPSSLLTAIPSGGPTLAPSNLGVAAVTPITTTSSHPQTLAISHLDTSYAIPTTQGPFSLDILFGLDYYPTPRHHISMAAVTFTAGSQTTKASMGLYCATSTSTLSTTASVVSMQLPCYVVYNGNDIMLPTAHTVGIPVTITMPLTTAGPNLSTLVPSSSTLTAPVSSPLLVKGPPCMADDQGVRC